MRFIGWMYDIAREQSPKEPILREMLSRSLNSGYNAVGFYLEHRFAYKSAPWAVGPGALQPSLVRKMIDEFPGLRIIPFLNVLGHMEGFIRSEGGQWLAEGPSPGSQQMCPSRQECVDFARGLVSDALEVFDDEWVHLGGDETTQLGQCPLCAARAEEIGKAGIYEEYFVPLCEWIVALGKRPCLWGDMLLEHPSVLEKLPKKTIIFDWQYWENPTASTQKFLDAGFEVVCCPAVHTYDSAWCYLDLTQRNIDEHRTCARELDTLGVLVTTWEFSFFTNYMSTMPVIYSAGRRLASEIDWDEALRNEGGDVFFEMANAIGREIVSLSPFLGTGWRRLRDALVIKQNPFYLWQDCGEEAGGPIGDAVLAICEPILKAENPPHVRFPALLNKNSVLWVRSVESARQLYVEREFRESAKVLASTRGLFLEFSSYLQHFAKQGGSAADINRLWKIRAKILEICRRIRDLKNSQDHLPAFEVLIHDGFVAGDQATWRTGQYR